MTCPVLANSVDPDQLASGEANWSGSALFAIQYVNLYQQSIQICSKAQMLKFNTVQIGQAILKHVLGHMQTMKAQISLNICAVWSGPSLSESFDTIECINREQMPRWDLAVVLYQSESVHFGHIRIHLFAELGPKNNVFQSNSTDVFVTSLQQSQWKFISIAPDKLDIHTNIFLISPWNHILWILLEASWLSLNLDQIPHSPASELSLHCLIQPVCSNIFDIWLPAKASSDWLKLAVTGFYKSWCLLKLAAAC